MPRLKIHEDDAARQRACRDRKRQRLAREEAGRRAQEALDREERLRQREWMHGNICLAVERYLKAGGYADRVIAEHMRMVYEIRTRNE